jgi:ribonucleotide reductase beta subunit family protein with ferritin-like domain
MSKLPIETCNLLFGLYKYPAAKQIMEKQQDISWTAQEIPVDKDRQDYKTKLTKEQLDLVTFTLQIFVEIEQEVGNVWNNIANWFPHSEIEGACTEIARMEKSVHAFFYQKMSDVLNIDPEEISKNQQTISVLKEKLSLIKKITSSFEDNKLLSLAVVACIEQVLLFSNFAMLKSFQSNGNNLIKNTITGVDFVVQDEQLHGEFAAYLFKTVIDEDGKRPSTEPCINTNSIESTVNNILQEIIEHEDAVINYMFKSTEHINGITSEQLKVFIRSRANHVMDILGYKDIYSIQHNTIADWFYKSSTSIKNHDFFAGITNQYSRSWKTESFSRLPYLQGKLDINKTVLQDHKNDLEDINGGDK